MGLAVVFPLALAAWMGLLAMAYLLQRLTRREVVEIELNWWKIDFFFPNCSFAACTAPRARQLRLHRWFTLGVAASLLMGLYACVLLITEAAVLMARLRRPGEAGAAPSQLQLAIPGVTLPASHAAYIWLAVLLSMGFHEAGHGLAAAAESVDMGGGGIAFTFLLPAAYVLLDDADMARADSWQALRIACAGAWHNAVLSALCWAGMAGVSAACVAGAPQPVMLALGYTGSVSAALGLLNMAPVHFLDGEAVVRVLLAGGRAGLPQAHRQQPGALAQRWCAVRRRAAAGVLHLGTAGLAAVVVLHAACLRWCAA